MKKIPNWIIVISILGLLVASKFIFFAKKVEKGLSPEEKKKLPVAVNYFVVKSTSFSNDVFTTGKIGAFNQIEILPEVAGKITAVYFKEGETVSKGALLVKLNSADLEAQLLKTQTQLKLSEQKLARLKKLLAINGISQEDYDMQENEVATYKADEAYTKAQLAKTNIVAPFNGAVGLKNISEGSYVNATTPIASLVQLQPLFVEFSIPEKYSSFFKKGVRVNFSNDNLKTTKTFSATIYAIEPVVDEITKTIKARASYNGSETFYPGSFVKVFVNLGETNNALMVPTECVIATLKGQKLFVNRNGTAEEIQVEIGVRTDDKIQIIKGLMVNDTVLTTGLLSVRNDSKLKLLKSVN
ncbi:efflux RND transporter periplasmic adaptor subunit [Aurantibacillus circumpalustris]|uniref:efflux RND transporter periplasmic adaptor subunit n=1 Tax=Aurantibacillus circumpalustris TaxID=3036359 RepID=UPI00295B8A86|nr:efflux RND transporter periplasmic adaptor subunit [Aurantibacillus circumpalustris]